MMYTDVAPRPMMKLASVGPCTSSLGTTRKNVVYPDEVRVGRVADDETWARLESSNNEAEASTSWLPDGPITATMESSATNFWATVVAMAGSSWVSSSTNWMGMPPARLCMATA